MHHSPIEQLAAGQYLTVARSGGDYAPLAKALGRDASASLKFTVAATMAMSRAATNALAVLRSAQAASGIAQGTAAAGEEMAASITTISATMDALSGHARQLDTLARSGTASARETAAIMRDVKAAVESTQQVLDRLRETARSIEGASDAISKIAFQTNMLALNASVEAARAGEAGKGFAVVAEEVKRLAGQTKDATVNIGQAAERLRGDIGGIGATLTTVADASDRGMDQVGALGDLVTDLGHSADALSGGVTEVVATLSQQREAVRENARNGDLLARTARETSEQIEVMLGGFDVLEGILAARLDDLGAIDVPHREVHKAKAAHLLFMHRIASVLAGRRSQDPDALPSATTCAFGQWREAQRHAGDDGIAGQLQALDAPHRRVHELGARAIRKLRSGDANGALADFLAAQQASDEVVAVLDRIA